MYWYFWYYIDKFGVLEGLFEVFDVMVDFCKFFWKLFVDNGGVEVIGEGI